MFDEKLASMKPRVSYERKEQLRLALTLSAFGALALFISVIGVVQSRAVAESCYSTAD